MITKFKTFESKKKQKECEHKNKKNLSSNSGGGNGWDLVEVECKDCGMRRNETRYPNGRIECSKWFTKK